MSSAEDAVSALQLLAAMYPMDGELELGDAAAAALSAANEGAEPSFTSPLEVVVGVPIEDDVDEPRRVDLVVTLPPSGGCRLAVRQPPFLPNSAYQTLADALPAPQDELPSDTIMAAIDAIRATAPALADEVEKEQLEKEGRRGSDDVVDDGPLERVWFWFPSLSTREKRKDLVNYAATYRLNGFVLSGKPALLCVEGGGRAVDRYMADIKSVSWGDIPSFQKKVTERLRIPLAESERKFTTMTDVTSLVPHYGTYNHRGDMSEVKRLCDQWGVGQDFGAVVMNARED